MQIKVMCWVENRTKVLGPTVGWPCPLQGLGRLQGAESPPLVQAPQQGGASERSGHTPLEQPSDPQASQVRFCRSSPQIPTVKIKVEKKQVT